MNIKKLIKKEIERRNLDGLFCLDVPCGCEKDDLAPCGTENFEFCYIGKRVDYKADELCGCNRQGQDHWHIMPRKYQQPTKQVKK